MNMHYEDGYYVIESLRGGKDLTAVSTKTLNLIAEAKRNGYTFHHTDEVGKMFSMTVNLYFTKD
jgi:hypothetical protein